MDKSEKEKVLQNSTAQNKPRHFWSSRQRRARQVCFYLTIAIRRAPHDEKDDSFLGVDTEEQIVVYIATVGKKKEGFILVGNP